MQYYITISMCACICYIVLTVNPSKLVLPSSYLIRQEVVAIVLFHSSNGVSVPLQLGPGP